MEGTFLHSKTVRQTATEWNKIGIMNGIGMESFWYFETAFLMAQDAQKHFKLGHSFHRHLSVCMKYKDADFLRKF